MGCYRYIELNPVRTGMVQHPAEYQWSSYCVNEQGENSRLITSHALYDALSLTSSARQAIYRELFRCELNPDLISQLRKATNGNYVLGTERFEVFSRVGLVDALFAKKAASTRPSSGCA